MPMSARSACPGTVILIRPRSTSHSCPSGEKGHGRTSASGNAPDEDPGVPEAVMWSGWCPEQASGRAVRRLGDRLRGHLDARVHDLARGDSVAHRHAEALLDDDPVGVTNAFGRLRRRHWYRAVYSIGTPE